MLSFSSHEASGVLILTAEKSALEGEVPTSQREWLYKTIESRTDPRFAIDLGELEYLSSSEIGYLITLRRRIDSRKGKVVLFQVDGFIVDILRTMRLDKFFLFAEDLNGAIAALSA